jgi:hypothetical protein
MKNQTVVPTLLRHALVLIVASSGCVGSSESPQREASAEVMKLYGGEAGYELIASPFSTRVTAYRVAPIDTQDPPVVRQIGGAAILGRPILAERETREDLRAILTDPAAYSVDPQSSCNFEPGVAIRFQGEAASIDVVFSFVCDELEVYQGGKRIGHAGFTGRRGDLVAVVRGLIPAEGAIDGL